MTIQTTRGGRLAGQVFAWQCALATAAALIALLAAGAEAGIAAFYGGFAIAALPTVYFAWRVFSRDAEIDPPQAVVGAFYQGEIGKFALTAMLFAAGIALFAQHFLAMLLGYMAALGGYWAVMATEGLRTGAEY